MQNNNLHILISTAWYKDEQYPNAGSFVEEQARMYLKKGHKVTVLHPFLMGRFFDKSWKKKAILSVKNDVGINTIRVGIPPVLPKAKKLTYKKLTKKCIDLFDDYISKEGVPDIIHSHSFFMGGLIGYELSNKYNIPLFHTEHASSLITKTQEYNNTDKSWVKRGFIHAKKVFFVSSFSKEKTLNTLNVESNNVDILPNMVDSYFFEEKLNNNNNKFNYLIIGNFDDNKNQTLAIESFAKTVKEFPDSTLTVIGKGKHKNELLLLANKLNIQDKINWKQDLTRQEVKTNIVNTNVMLSCSKIETFGLTIAEGHACGKPAIVTNSGGIKDIITKENGIITTYEIKDFSESMIKVQKDYETFQPQKIRELCENTFSEEVIYNKIVNFYEAVIQ